MSMNPIIRHRLEEQGFCGLDDATLAEVGPWLRWSPVLCTFFMILGVAIQSPVVLWSRAAAAFFGAFLPFHPFDLLLNYGVGDFTSKPSCAHHRPQRSLASGLAFAWLIA